MSFSFVPGHKSLFFSIEILILSDFFLDCISSITFLCFINLIFHENFFLISQASRIHPDDKSSTSCYYGWIKTTQLLPIPFTPSLLAWHTIFWFTYNLTSSGLIWKINQKCQIFSMYLFHLIVCYSPFKFLFVMDNWKF